ncbi:MAG TPA: efflux RND transporter periplasmic adaptor subunit [Thermoanaerobaculaceae bacterium]|nr:efflux RND transporter periplasmic adaptor subunit [Thermoanaerobaculaceae bacterium]HPS78447.1 efflux RND transporter periplasmic adaptor subunit [Thermoanaerobaculaceae bacterium]
MPALAVVAAGTFLATGRGPAEVVAVAARSAGGRAAALLNASGYVTPRRRSTVAAKITGRVQEVLVDEGMVVTEGQVLARLDESDVRARLNAALADRDSAAAAIADLEVNLANAERELGRQHDLEKDGVASVQALDTARTQAESFRARLALARQQVKGAEAAIGIARQDLENCVVKAPFAGVAVSKDAQVGEMVSPVSAGGGFTRTGISTIVDMTSLEIEVDVNESYIARVQPGQKVEATLDAYPDWRIPASVRTVIPTADRQKATVKVRISFGALDPRMLPDMGVKVAFLADEMPGQEAAAAAVIPRAAVRKDGETTVVLLVRDGRLERRAVRLGAERADDVEVLAGVASGDMLVVQGPPDLKDGQKVRVK